jgi:hypothetical protein
MSENSTYDLVTGLGMLAVVVMRCEKTSTRSCDSRVQVDGHEIPQVRKILSLGMSADLTVFGLMRLFARPGWLRRLRDLPYSTSSPSEYLDLARRWLLS